MERQVLRLSIDPFVPLRMRHYRRRIGIPQSLILGRLLNWFAEQPAAVREGILAGESADAEASRLVMDRLAET
ncbi:MAG: hypothetical protein ACFCVE_14675 [Phycisphaerae bacterium]